MLHEIRDSDNKCTDMVADYFQYHRVSMNSYLTRRVHSQEREHIFCVNTGWHPAPYSMLALRGLV